MMGGGYQPGQSLNGMRGGKLDILQHPNGQAGGHQPPSQPTTSISEAAYFIQRVNRILQNQNETTALHKAQTASYSQKQPGNMHGNQYLLKA